MPLVANGRRRTATDYVEKRHRETRVDGCAPCGPAVASVSMYSNTGTEVDQSPRLGFSVPVLVLLAALGAPRVVLHDLDIIHEGTFTNSLFVFVPPLIWIIATLVARAQRPFVTHLAIGAIYGVFLLLGHQIFWDSAFGGNPPALGGNLSDLDPAVETVILRVLSGLSSLLTGVIVGVATGAVAVAISRARQALGPAASPRSTATHHPASRAGGTRAHLP